MALVRVWDSSLGTIPMQIPFPPSGAAAVGGAPANQASIAAFVGTVTSDPGTAQDSTQGYTVGSLVFNNTAGQLRVWSCRDNTAGAAKWVFEGADFANGGTNPNTEATAFGGGAALIAAEGNINRQILSVANAINPAATGSDYVLAFYTLPAASFDLLGRGLGITAMGSMGNNTNTKTIKIIAGVTAPAVGSIVSGGTTIASGVFTTTTAAGGWELAANIFKYGANGSNTQLALHQSAQSGSIVAALAVPSSLTLTESAAISFAVTGNAATVITDISFNFLEVNALN